MKSRLTLSWLLLGLLGVNLAVPVPASAASARQAPLARQSAPPHRAVAPLTRDQVCAEPGPNPLTLQPGVNQVVAVARGHLNRLVTPFPQVRAKTIDESASAEVAGDVVYFASYGEAPVTLYLTPADSEATALSLTLVPCSIPPRELKLLLAGGSAVSPIVPGAPGALNQPYVDALTQAFRELALQRVPQGYALRAVGRTDPTPGCAQAGLTVTPAQVLEGTTLLILVARVENTSSRTLEIDEAACALPRVAAVAVWPRVALEPGQTTELYLAVQRTTGTTEPRPSVLAP